MVPRTTFTSEDPKDILNLSEKLKEIKVNNINIEQMIYGKSLTIRLMFWNEIPIITRLGNNIDPKDIGMQILKIQDKAGMSAYHVPEGILMVPKKNKSFALDNAPYETKSIYKRILETFVINN